MAQLHVTQECNQEGDNCNDVITGGSTEKIGKKVLDRQPRALHAECSHLAGLAEEFVRIRTWRSLIEVDTANGRRGREPHIGYPR